MAQQFDLVVHAVSAAFGDDDGKGFRVEANLEGAPQDLRPGMQGVGKLKVREERLLWIWFRPMIRWLQLQLWSWLP